MVLCSRSGLGCCARPLAFQWSGAEQAAHRVSQAHLAEVRDDQDGQHRNHLHRALKALASEGRAVGPPAAASSQRGNRRLALVAYSLTPSAKQAQQEKTGVRVKTGLPAPAHQRMWCSWSLAAEITNSVAVTAAQVKTATTPSMEAPAVVRVRLQHSNEDPAVAVSRESRLRCCLAKQSTAKAGNCSVAQGLRGRDQGHEEQQGDDRQHGAPVATFR